MVAHVVLLKPRADLPAEERRAFVNAFERAAREITSVRTVQIGFRVIHGAGYELAMPDTADFVAIIEFDDVAGLQAYLGHPAHVELGRLFGLSLSSALVYDFQLGGVEMLWKDNS
jgi:stress responsive alpha/beta barrel protein